MIQRFGPFLRRLSCAAMLAQMLAAAASPLAPAQAETPSDLGQPEPPILSDLAPDAVAVTDAGEIKKKLSELTV